MEKKSYPMFYGGVKQHFPAAVVAGGFVFLGDISGREFETGKVKAMDVKVQTETAWTKIKSFLEEVGTSLDNIVRLEILLPKIKDYDTYIKTTHEFWARECPNLLANRPVQCLMEANLYLEEMLVAIDVIAVMPTCH